MTRITAALDGNCHFLMSAVIATVVPCGFSHTDDKRMFQAIRVRPDILYLHAAVFSGWANFLILQSAVPGSYRTRRIGYFTPSSQSLNSTT